jgi:Phage protein (N4 Gp49/phage Sf6 gene 66) family
MAQETDEARKIRTHLSSVRISDDESKAVQKTPNRVTLDFMLSQVENEEYINPSSIPHMTLLVLTLKNGFAVVGTSAPADAGNFDKELGRKFAKEDCIRQMWRLYGFTLREKLAGT